MRWFSLLLIALFLGTALSLSAQESRGRRVMPVQKVKTEQPVVEITAFENKIIVNNATVGSLLEIYSVIGTKVKEIEMKETSGEYTVDIAKGYYIIRVGETVRKIAIR